MLLPIVFQCAEGDFNWTVTYMHGPVQVTTCALNSDLRKIRLTPDLPERNCCLFRGMISYRMHYFHGTRGICSFERGDCKYIKDTEEYELRTFVRAGISASTLYSGGAVWKLGPDTDYLHLFLRSFSRFVQSDAGVVSRVRQRPLASTSLPRHYHLNIRRCPIFFEVLGHS